jgi:hypothetical protein
VEIAFGSCSIAGENRGNTLFRADLIGQRDAIGHTELGTQMRDHSDDLEFLCTEVKGAVATFGKSTWLSHPLGEQSVERNFPSGKDTEIPVHGQDVFIAIQGKAAPNGDSFLTDTGEPFRQFPLAQEHEHFLLDHARLQDSFIDTPELVVGESGTVVLHHR